MDDTLEALHRLVEEGKVRYLGCSNHHCWRLERANALSRAKQQAPYVAIQNAYTYLQPNPGADFGIARNLMATEIRLPDAIVERLNRPHLAEFERNA